VGPPRRKRQQSCRPKRPAAGVPAPGTSRPSSKWFVCGALSLSLRNWWGPSVSSLRGPSAYRQLALVSWTSLRAGRSGSTGGDLAGDTGIDSNINRSTSETSPGFATPS